MVVSGSISGTTNVVVGAGVNPATLAGTGMIATANGGAVTVNNAASLAPGASAAGLSINAQASGASTLALSAGSTLQLSIANSNSAIPAAPGLADYSKLALGTGVSATLAGVIVTAETGTVNFGDLFTVIISGTPVNGIFTNTSHIAGTTYGFTDAAGQQWEINYKYDGSLGTTGFQEGKSVFEGISGGTNVALLAVPEPNSWSMLLGSLGVALGLQRFRRRGA